MDYILHKMVMHRPFTLIASTPRFKKLSTVKPRFTAVFGGKEISAVNRGPR